MPNSVAAVRRIKLGSHGLEVSVQGLGCMGMSAFYGPPKSESDMISLIYHAVRSGVTFLDTSDIYGPFTDEILSPRLSPSSVCERECWVFSEDLHGQVVYREVEAYEHYNYYAFKKGFSIRNWSLTRKLYSGSS